MSNLRSILILLCLVLALAGFEFYASRSGIPHRATARTTLVDSTSPIVAFSLCRAGTSQVRLEKRDNGWRIVEPFESGVDERVVLKALDLISFARIVDVMSESELLRLGRARADFSLESPAVTLEVEQEGGSIERFGFGSQTPTGDGVYVSIAGLPAVFVVPKDVFAAVDKPADAFRIKSLVLVNPMSVRAFSVKRGSALPDQFDRTADGWSAPAGKPSVKRIEDFLASLSTAESSEFVWPTVVTNGTGNVAQSATLSAAAMAAYGLDPESAVTVTLKCIDGRDRQVSFGKSAGEGLVYALVHGGAAVVSAKAELKDTLVHDQKLFVDSRLFPVEAAAVSAFTIVEGKKTCTLAKDASGVWRLEAPVSALADSETAETALRKIVALMPSDLDQNGIAVSIPASEPVKVSNSSVLSKAGLVAFRSKEILKIDPQLVKRLSSSGEGSARSGQAVAYSKDSRVWRVEKPEKSGEVDEKAIASVLSALNPLTALRVESLKADATNMDDYGLDKPYLTVAVDPISEDAVRRNLIIGAKTEGGRFATVGSSDSVFVISDAALRKLSVSFVR